MGILQNTGQGKFAIYNSGFLTSLGDCHVESFTDTAMAVQRVGEEQDLSQAAIASEEAAIEDVRASLGASPPWDPPSTCRCP